MRKLLLYNFTILALVIITGILGCSKDEDLSSVKIDGAEYVSKILDGLKTVRIILILLHIPTKLDIVPFLKH